MSRIEGVRTFVGIDAHSKECTIRVLNRKGRIVRSLTVPTTKEALREGVKGLCGPVWAMCESGPMASLVADALRDRVDRMIVCVARENRLISESEDKSDPQDAFRLADLCRMGRFKEVYMPPAASQQLREVVRQYQKTVQDLTRAKNRLRAKFREHGVFCERDVYSDAGREGYLQQVKPTVRFLLELQYVQLATVEQIQAKLSRRFQALLKKRPAYRLLQTIPGIGPVVSAIMVALIDDPWRFGKRGLWCYSGLSVKGPWSGSPKKAKKGGSKNGNRLMKYATFQAVPHAIVGSNRFARRYAALIEEGKKPAMAERTIARKLLATVLAVWKSGTAYQDSWPT
jgi:transposase